MAAGENPEIAGLQLEHNRASNSWLFARSRPKLFRRAADHRLGVRQQDVVPKGVLDGYRLRRSVRNNWVIVDSVGKLVQALAVAAEVLFEYGQVERSQVLNRVCAQFCQFLSRNFTNTRQPANWQWQQKGVNLFGLDDKQPIGFPQSEASLAKNLLGATPAEAVRFSSWRICGRMVRATRVAVAKPFSFSVTSRYASSRDSGSIRSV